MRFILYCKVTTNVMDERVFCRLALVSCGRERAKTRLSNIVPRGHGHCQSWFGWSRPHLGQKNIRLSASRRVKIINMSSLKMVRRVAGLSGRFDCPYTSNRGRESLSHRMGAGEEAAELSSATKHVGAISFWWSGCARSLACRHPTSIMQNSISSTWNSGSQKWFAHSIIGGLREFARDNLSTLGLPDTTDAHTRISAKKEKKRFSWHCNDAAIRNKSAHYTSSLSFSFPFRLLLLLLLLLASSNTIKHPFYQYSIGRTKESLVQLRAPSPVFFLRSALATVAMNHQTIFDSPMIRLVVNNNS